MTQSTRITPSFALWNQRQILSDIRERIESLFDAVNHPTDLLLYQWVQLMSFALEFRPDFILELGRGAGNSTCAFTEAANHIPGCKVVSICYSDDWDKRTGPNVKKVVPAEWFRPLTINRENILHLEYLRLLAGKERILLFWDAHGFDVAECILGEILPLMREKEHLVVMHDMSDARYSSLEQLDYKGNRLWRGNDWQGPRLMLGTIDSCVEQAVAILDFTTRNRLSLRSADHDFHTVLGKEHEKLSELNRCLGHPFYDDTCQAHWVWFTLNEHDGPFFFPRFVPGA